jgi:para-nitrobenzyl esterase
MAVVAAVLGSVLALAASAGSAPPSSLVVQTKGGAVAGVLVGAENEWRGVPYAAPPVGPLRWQPPMPVTPWSGVRDASSFHDPCIQPAFLPDGSVVTVGAEDCLYLNVFTPASASARSKLPVMVHLHPGGNFFGSPYTDAAAFTARGVIVVTVAYRLGPMGALGHPELTQQQGSSGEYFLLDQLAALQWVHDNIAAFGGNPGNVTLFGSSAGSFDTAGLMASPLSAGLIQRAAVQGISFWSLTGESNTVQDREGDGLRLADQTGCSSAADPIACMRALPADQIVLTVGGGDIGPTVGGKVLPKPIPQLLASRTTVPLLVGFDREEDAGAYACPNNNSDCGPAGLLTQNPNAAYSRGLNSIFGPNNFQTASGYYPISAYDSGLWAAVAAQTDAVRGCATRRLANADRAPVWRYLYTHRYENDPNLALFRASHVLEDPFLWDSDVFGFGYTETPAEEGLSARLADYWTNFAKNGNPNGSGQPAWPQYNTTSEPTLVLDEQVSTVTNYHDSECSYVDTVDPFPPPWAPGKRTGPDPTGFIMGHARALLP